MMKIEELIDKVELIYFDNDLKKSEALVNALGEDGLKVITRKTRKPKSEITKEVKEKSKQYKTNDYQGYRVHVTFDGENMVFEMYATKNEVMVTNVNTEVISDGLIQLMIIVAKRWYLDIRSENPMMKNGIHFDYNYVSRNEFQNAFDKLFMVGEIFEAELNQYPFYKQSMNRYKIHNIGDFSHYEKVKVIQDDAFRIRHLKEAQKMKDLVERLNKQHVSIGKMGNVLIVKHYGFGYLPGAVGKKIASIIFEGKVEICLDVLQEAILWRLRIFNSSENKEDDIDMGRCDIGVFDSEVSFTNFVDSVFKANKLKIIVTPVRYDELFRRAMGILKNKEGVKIDKECVQYLFNKYGLKDKEVANSCIGSFGYVTESSEVKGLVKFAYKPVVIDGEEKCFIFYFKDYKFFDAVCCLMGEERQHDDDIKKRI